MHVGFYWLSASWRKKTHVQLINTTSIFQLPNFFFVMGKLDLQHSSVSQALNTLDSISSQKSSRSSTSSSPSTVGLEEAQGTRPTRQWGQREDDGRGAV
jgi:hypothetical protein